jgi:hypothetical protein
VGFESVGLETEDILHEHNDRVWLFGGSQLDGTTLSDIDW